MTNISHGDQPDSNTSGTKGLQSDLNQGELLYLTHELSRMISTYFDRAMALYNVTHAQWWAVMQVHAYEGVTQTELASIMRMGRASTGKLLERLERLDWIERRDDPEDTRVRRVFLGKNIGSHLALVNREAIPLYNALLGNIPPEEQKATLASLRKIKANAEQGLGLNPP